MADRSHNELCGRGVRGGRAMATEYLPSERAAEAPECRGRPGRAG